MERHEILRAREEVKKYSSLPEIKNNLEKKYFIAYGKYENYELKKAIDEMKPVVIDNNFLIGYDDDNVFVNDQNSTVLIERMVKAVIIEGVKSESDIIDTDADIMPRPVRDPFCIIERNEWDDISEIEPFLRGLTVGETYLPPHSAIFHFLKPTDEQKKKNIVSMLDGVTICIYQRENAIDNIIHEIGHLFWRDCLKFEEKKAFEHLFKLLKPSAIYSYEWERETAEEVFCTIYKWFVKSILMNKAFFNILEFEEPRGLALMESVMDRIRQDAVTKDVWDLSKKDVFDYINPVFDKTTGKFMRKAGSFDRVKDVKIPSELLNNVECYRDGVEYIRLEKALVPVKGNMIDWENLEKAKYIRKEPDGKGGFRYIYKEDQKDNKNNKNKGDINSIKDIESKYEEKGVSLNIIEKQSSIELSKIIVNEKGKGIGSQVMKDIISYAERKGKPISLTPDSKFGTSISKLKDFYKKFGFVENKGKNKDYSITDTMYREPGKGK